MKRMPQKVMLAMSGGVDSSASAILLLEAGYELLGATLRLFDDEAKQREGACGASSDIEDARRVAQRLGFPHEVFPYMDRFRAQVIDRFADAYRAGNTPNPCIDCNRTIKFGALLDEALARGFDAMATGHYARVARDEETGRWLLKKAADEKKDQTYVLYQLTQEQLAHVLFPLGGLCKEEVRAIAQQHGLVNAQKPDSQDICFIPDGDYASFIRRHTGEPSAPGRFVDSGGNPLGEHQGLVHYTVGQRKGLGAAFGKPMYVLAKNARENSVTLGSNEELFAREMLADRVNLISIERLSAPMRVQAKTRYRHAAQPATLFPAAEGRVRVVFDEAQRAITPGQAAVFYDGELVVGGGTIVAG